MYGKDNDIVDYRYKHTTTSKTIASVNVLLNLLAFVKSDRAGTRGGLSHFGFRLTDPADIDDALLAVAAAGAEILRSGEFEEGSPYLYFLDPDGYEIEIWYE